MKNCTSTNDSEVSITSSKPTKEIKVDYTSEEFWKDAPEGATHYSYTGCACFYKFTESEELIAWSENEKGWIRECSSSLWRIDNIKPIPAKPVYTQEMHDKGEFPSIGMVCMIKKKHQEDCHYNKGYINGYSQDGEWIIFTDYLGCIESHHIKNGIYDFKPIDTRTDKEKSIDDYIKSQHYDLETLSESIKTIMSDAFKAGVAWSKGNE